MRMRRRHRRYYYNSGCLVVLCVFTALLIGGCDYIMPRVEKSKTEKKQLQQLIRQNEILERIATAIEGRQ